MSRYPLRRGPGTLPALSALLLLLSAFPVSTALGEPPPPLTLSLAVETALRNHPQLAGFPFDVRSAEGRVLQASLRPNPEAEIEVANLWGNLPGTSRSETTLGVSQRLEIGGKRRARTLRAESELPVLRRDYEALRLDVVAEAKRAFIGLLGAQRRLDLAREGQEIASRLADTASAQVSAGSVSPIEETRAKVALAVAGAQVLRIGRELEEGRRELAAAMGADRPTFAAVVGELPEEIAVPDLDALLSRIPLNPDLARWEPEKARRAAALTAERTLAVPDVTLSGAYRHLREESENTFVLGLSVPLPLFDRNQGTIREAGSQLAKIEQERRGTENRLRALVIQRHAATASAAREARTLKDGALANAQAAYDAVNEGYRLGKFRYLDVLDAGRALIETRVLFVEAVLALHLALSDLERLSGGPIVAETR